MENVKMPALEKFEEEAKNEVNNQTSDLIKKGYNLESITEDNKKYMANAFYIAIADFFKGDIQVSRQSICLDKTRLFDCYVENNSYRDIISHPSDFFMANIEDARLTEKERNYAKEKIETFLKGFKDVTGKSTPPKQPGDEE